ncbi:hypothetical protein GmHk_06G016747 [Glycine max]|nr:hypothetical protein GmHk_06G016747 [Glycine max]
MCSVTDYKTKSIGGMCILLQMWAWERCITLASKKTPSQVENKPLGHRWLRRGNQHIDNDDVRVFCRKLDIMKHYEVRTCRKCRMAEVAETLQYMVSPQERNTWTVDDLVPYVEKITILSEEKERITEPVSHGPASERQFPAQEFHILQSSVETQGIGKRREAVEAEEYSQQMAERAMECITCHKHLLSTQWNVPGPIPNMGDLLGVDLRHEFSVEADEEEAGRHRGRRNLDRQARRWDRPCGTSSRHHGHQNE